MLASPAVPTLDFPARAPANGDAGQRRVGRFRVSSNARFRIVSRLGLATVVATFALIVLGSIVRTTGSGLACPDWPLCHGRLIPPFEFNVMVEWFHRLAALVVSLLVVSTVVTVLAERELRARLGGLAALSVALLTVQILLGALTVWKLLDPAVVGGHLAVALLFFASLLALTLVARQEAEPELAETAPRPEGLLPLLGVTCVLVYFQSVLGGAVSANHASLACPDWPRCNGEWFPPMRGLVGLQMAHRWGSYVLLVALAMVTVRARSSADPVVARAGSLLLGLTVGQIALGVSNIALGIEVWLSALHLANAAGMLAVTIAATFRVASMRAGRTSLSPVHAS
jgi:cytochrome c oxidase assembly protein subunit 15